MGDEDKHLDGVRPSESQEPGQGDVIGVDFAERLRQEEAAARARAEAARKAAEEKRRREEAERKRQEQLRKQREAEERKHQEVIRKQQEAERRAEEKRLHPHSNRLLIILTAIGVIVVAGLAGYYFTIGPGGQSAPTPAPSPTSIPSVPPKPLPPVGPAAE